MLLTGFPGRDCNGIKGVCICAFDPSGRHRPLPALARILRGCCRKLMAERLEFGGNDEMMRAKISND